MKTYAGIGSRTTPPEVLERMTTLAKRFRHRGFILRSGAAPGADAAFEAGAGSDKQIFLPWKGFQGHDGTNAIVGPSTEAMELAATIHPAWQFLKPGAKKLVARNMHQILDPDLDDPVEFVICWTKDGCEGPEDYKCGRTGGTGVAILLAAQRGIPVINLFNDLRPDRLLSW